MPRRVAPGEQLAVVGDRPELGSWDPSRGLALARGPGSAPGADNWTAAVQLAAGPLSFKVGQAAARAAPGKHNL